LNDSNTAHGYLKDTSWFRLHGLTLHGNRTDGYGINGTAQYVRYFSIRDFGGACTALYRLAPPVNPSTICRRLRHRQPYSLHVCNLSERVFVDGRDLVR
jgi:hypothetical protein